MTQDLPDSNLASFYLNEIKKAKEYLNNKFPLEDCLIGDVDYPKNIRFKQNWVVWKIRTKCELRSLTLLLAIPPTFPDSLPKIYLSNKDYLEIAPIPHVDKNRFVCVRDENIIVFNERRTTDALEQFIQIAINEIIVKGIKRENRGDIKEEFLAYWNLEIEAKYLSIFVPNDKPELVKTVVFNKIFLDSNYIVAKTIEDAKAWLSHVGIEISKIIFFNGLYLPLKIPFSLPLPQTNKDIYNILQKTDIDVLKAVRKFYGENQSNLFILFSTLVNKEYVLSGWKHKPWKKEVFEGFRNPSKLPLSLKFTRTYSYPIEKIKIERLDQQRLFFRGGKGINTSVEKSSVAIIGLGAIGSALAMSLAKCGVSDFTFVDNENIEPENISRHLSNFTDVNTKKTIAVKQILEKKFPHVHCEISNKDVLDQLQARPNYLNTVNIIVSATANFSAERRLNYLLRNKSITSPVVFMWLEPYGVAGHLLYIHKDNDGCYQCCFNDEGKFNFSVGNPNEALNIREAGCQSSFQPYSALDVDSFIVYSCRKILNLIEKDSDTNMLFTWLGDLEFYKDAGYKVKDEWLADSSFSVHKRSLKVLKNCKTCRNE